MILVNLNNINKENLYYCYSPPLCKWLELKNIYPIKHDVYKKPGRFFGNEFDVFVLTDILKEYLEEWSENKKKHIYALPTRKCMVMI